MSEHMSPKQPASAAPGVKLLVTAAALAGTLVGWAAFALKQEAATLSSPAAQVLQLPPLPTLVSPPSQGGIVPAGLPTNASLTLPRVNAPLPGSSLPVTVTQSSR